MLHRSAVLEKGGQIMAVVITAIVLFFIIGILAVLGDAINDLYDDNEEEE